MASHTTGLTVPFPMSAAPSSGDDFDPTRTSVSTAVTVSAFDPPYIATLPRPEASEDLLDVTSSVSKRGGVALIDDEEDPPEEVQATSEDQTNTQDSQGTLDKRSNNTGLAVPIGFGLIVVVCGLSVTGSYLAWRHSRATARSFDLELNQRSTRNATVSPESQTAQPPVTRTA